MPQEKTTVLSKRLRELAACDFFPFVGDKAFVLQAAESLERQADLLEALRDCREVLGSSARESLGFISQLSDNELGRLWIATFKKVNAAIDKAEGR